MSAQPMPKTESAPAPLASLLERHWASSRSSLPLALWRKVLLGPVEEILSRPGKAFRAHLVEAAWRLVAPDREPPAELGAVIEVLHAGSMVVDDIEDGSSTRRGGPALHTLYGVPLALNAGNWMYFWPFELLRGLALPPHTESLLIGRTLTTLSDCHRGQALDVGVLVGDVEQARVADVVAETTALKTGALMGLAGALGAGAAGASGHLLEAAERFGRRLGFALQQLDDLGNLSGHKDPDKRHEDLRNGRLGWPWAWAAESLDADAFGKLVAAAIDLRNQGGDKTAGCEWLAARLKAVAGAERRRQIGQEVLSASRDLECVFGRTPVTAFLRNEIARLEASYG